MYLLKMNFKKIQIFDSSLLLGQSYFNNEEVQLYLMLQPLYYIWKRLGDTEKIVSWKSKSLWIEKFTTPTTIDDSFSASIKWYGDSNFCLIFKKSHLKQRNRTFTPPNRITFFILILNSDFNLKDCLFVVVKLVKNADPDKYVYSAHGIGFDSRS